MADHYSTDDVVATARSWIGTPYAHQQMVKGAGCDCLGLLMGVFREVHGRLPEKPPPYSREWAESSGRELLIEAAKRNLRPAIAKGVYNPGDVIIFRMRRSSPAKHCGIVSGPDEFIHAMEGHGVVASPFSPWWKRLIVAHYTMEAL